MSNSLVFLSEDKKTPLTDTSIIASALSKRHHDVIELARRYSSDLEEFGRVAFKTLPFETAGGEQSKQVMLLNEQQATLLITYMRNSLKVIKFKVALVKAFFAMREKLQEEKFKSLGQEIDQLRKIKLIGLIDNPSSLSYSFSCGTIHGDSKT